MSSTSPRWRLGLLVAALLLALTLLIFAQTQSGQGFTALKLIDFVEYWGAGQLLAAGENPYDLDRLGELEYQAGRPEDEKPIPMLNPPWTLPFVLPLGFLPARVGHLLWLLFHLTILVVSAEVLWRHFGGPDEYRLLTHLITWTFVPTSFAILAGQISPLLLLGAVGFLSFVRARRDLAAGAACTLLAVKPHLAYLFWLALLLWTIQHRRWRILLGGILAGLLLTGIALAFRPSVLVDYWHMLRTKPPEQFESPTLGTLLRYVLGEQAFRWQFLSMVPGLIWFVCWWPWRSRRDWDNLLPLLLLVSMLTAAYGAWLFDLVLLLVAVIQVAALVAGTSSPRRVVALIVHVAINGLAFLLWQVHEVRYVYFIWMTPALLVAYVLLPSFSDAAGRRTSPMPQAPVMERI